jgi:hypothetical protein
LFSSYDVIDSFFKWKPPIFFLDSNSPFNCLNPSIKILLPYIRKFLRKKIINLEKINFITNKNKSKTVLVLKIMELNVRIAIPQLVDKKQVYEEIPPVLVLSSFIPAPNQN